MSERRIFLKQLAAIAAGMVVVPSLPGVGPASVAIENPQDPESVPDCYEIACEHCHGPMVVTVRGQGGGVAAMAEDDYLYVPTLPVYDLVCPWCNTREVLQP